MTEFMVRPISSEQFALDQRVEDLLGKLLAGDMTAADQALYENLVARKSGLMRMRSRRFRGHQTAA